MEARPDIAEGRSCGECGLCCKLIGVKAISKAPFVWCKSYRKSSGCQVYETRPADCRSFVCYWMHAPNLGAEWRPDRCGFVMHVADSGARLNIDVDSAAPQKWRQEPYYSTLKLWAAQGRTHGLTLQIWIGRRCLELSPDGERDLGLLRPPAAVVRGARA